MRIGGEARLGYIRGRHWERFAAEVGLPPDGVLETCQSLAAAIPDRLSDVAAAARSEGVDDPIVDRLVDVVAAHCGACAATSRI